MTRLPLIGRTQSGMSRLLRRTAGACVTYHTDEDDEEVRQFNFGSVDEFRSYLKRMKLSRAVGFSF